MSFQASCPACAAPIEFTVDSSVVTICPNCRSAVGRADGALENLGKVSDLVQTDSPLRVGLRGKFKGVPFELVGRAQIRHSAGGVWDEWYAAFQGGKRWGWLAEAQGRYYLTFEKDTPSTFQVPSADDMEIDQEIMIPGLGNMVVAEIGSGEYASAEGEIPYNLVPGETFEFADLSGAGRKFATIDWSEAQPVFYAGGELPLERLGLAAAASRDNAERRVQTSQVNCPQCAGPLELQAPDETQRVACPYCGAMLDCDHGDLKFLKALGKKKVTPRLKLGSVGRFDPADIEADWEGPRDYKVIGFVRKKVTYEGIDYKWEEYLLYCPRQPFSWLVCSEGHWSFGQGVPAGDAYARGSVAEYDGRSFRIFDRSRPVVDWVIGEFYWKVSLGETVRSSDYISPPWMLSRETAVDPKEERQPKKNRRKKKQGEVNYTLLHYLPVEKVEQAFDVTDLGEPSGVAPNQVYPYKSIYKTFAMLAGIAIAIGFLMFASSGRRLLYSKSIQFQPGQTAEVLQPLSSSISGGDNIEVKVTATQWVYVEGEIIDPKTGKKREFGVPNGQAVYLSSLPKGQYDLRVRAKWKNKSGASPYFALQIREDVPRAGPLVVLIIVLGIVPAFVALHHLSFATRRWAESDYSPFQSE